jgi:hypothetical protein
MWYVESSKGSGLAKQSFRSSLQNAKSLISPASCSAMRPTTFATSLFYGFSSYQSTSTILAIASNGWPAQYDPASLLVLRSGRPSLCVHAMIHGLDKDYDYLKLILYNRRATRVELRGESRTLEGRERSPAKNRGLRHMAVLDGFVRDTSIQARCFQMSVLPVTVNLH